MREKSQGFNLRFKNEKSLLSELKFKITEELQKGAAPLVALDADGTLWAEDINHILLDYQDRRGLLKGKDLISSYKKDTERVKRCIEFAKRQSSFSVQNFKKYCKEALDERPIQVFHFQRELFRFLKEQSCKIIIVTASLKHLVKEALDRYHLLADEVLGVETEIKNDKFTDCIIEPVTYQEGKKEAWLNYAKNNPPILAGGNSQGDLPLLEIAKIPFIVNSAPSHHENFPSEQKMKEWAKKKNKILLEY